MSLPEFVPFPKIPRISREIIVTEKIDGTNAQVFIGEDGTVLSGSRNRWLNLESDNFGFAKWVDEHKDELRNLGPGRHFGEWWGVGIQRGYGGHPKTFSLFNTIRWCRYGESPRRIPTGDPKQEKWQDMLPECCELVPVLYRGKFDTGEIDLALQQLAVTGSQAAPGFMNPEGIVIFSTAAGIAFKKTIYDDDKGKNEL